MHLWLSLPTAIEKGSVRLLTQDKEVVETDGGFEFRNTRWSGPLRRWQIGFNNKPLSDAKHAAVEQLWRDTNAGTDTFNYFDEKSGDTARVRFDGDLQMVNTTMQIYRIDVFTLKEVRDISPEPTIAPAITGTIQVGHVASLSTGTWSGSPVRYDRQWTLNGLAVPGATGATYTPLSGDAGKMLGGYVVATDAYGGQTTDWAADVGRSRHDGFAQRADFQDHLKRRSQQRCRMLRLDLTDGTVLGFTDHDKAARLRPRRRRRHGQLPARLRHADQQRPDRHRLDAGNFEVTFPICRSAAADHSRRGGRRPLPPLRSAAVPGRLEQSRGGRAQVHAGNSGEWRVEGDKAIAEVRDERDRLNQTSAASCRTSATPTMPTRSAALPRRRDRGDGYRGHRRHAVLGVAHRLLCRWTF
jgi:hypothetical protein